MIIGYTTGVFDIFHIGHLNLIKRSKELCDYLIVGVSTDQLVIEQKKKDLINTYEIRKEIIGSLKYVDDVVAQETYEKIDAWGKLKFNKMFVGSDWKGSDRWNKLEEKFIPLNVSIIYLDYTKNISSTKLRKILNHEKA